MKIVKNDVIYLHPILRRDKTEMEDKTKMYGEKKALSKDKKNSVYSFGYDFNICMGESALPVTYTQTYLPIGILGLCTEGSAIIDVYMHEHHLSKGELMVILPGQIVSLKSKSPDFSINYFTVSHLLINDVLSGVARLSPLFFIHMRRKYHYKLSKDEVYRFSQYYNLIYSWVKPADNLFQREYIVNLLRLFYLDLYNNYRNNLLSKNAIRDIDSRKEKITYDFFLLIMQYFRENREIAFYAEKLHITPKYLTTVVKDVSGRPAKDWIVEYSIMEIKSLLKNPALNIQEITVKTNFSNQTSLSRFFKKHTGLSPTQYRMDK
ncbi:helix-turn-helix domain-containing protein [uncultured Dysgonomonas sp.]|uniref:HTH araC/xylS-type domain-containing protein n=1 Tax=uncultured Dysgonomonas sp. TaxID=206096 RepID=A0A212IYD2_9BACT|nr:helix-turn-helix domain-containing protein [uncultured Dysgonomonas sp.]SBV92201.1 conserved hypothetical protein [uncultured Dysgonomonas sp.]